MNSFISKKQHSAIIPINIGSALEWYEIFLYIYWAPVIEKVFFDFSTPLTNLISAILVFAFGFLSRPLGGIIFGYVGDCFGRKKSLILSITLVAVPSVLIGILPSYEMWDRAAPILLILMRLLQGIPAGGELPGAMCYLEEIANPRNRKYIGSYTFVGAQVGGIVSMLTCLFFELFCSPHFLSSWGWRISFLLGGCIGLLGSFLRKSLDESPAFEKLEKNHLLLKKPLKESICFYKQKMCLAFLISLSEVVGFFVISIFPVIYFKRIFGTSSVFNICFSAILLSISAVTIPLFGKYGSNRGYKPVFYFSFIGILLTSFLFYLSIERRDIVLTVLSECLFILFLNFQLALLPSLLTDLFPPFVRYTCIGLSFNLCDGVIGGIAPFAAIYLVKITHDPASFILLFVVSSLISLISMKFAKEIK